MGVIAELGVFSIVDTWITADPQNLRKALSSLNNDSVDELGMHKLKKIIFQFCTSS